MGVLKVSGSLDAGPPTVTSEAFPGASISVPLRLPSGSKSFSVGTGVLPRRLNSSLAYVALDGVGPAATVTQGSFLYLRSDQPFLLRLTTDDGSGGSVVTVLPVATLCLIEFDSTKFLKLLEGQGVANLEYFVCGDV